MTTPADGRDDVEVEALLADRYLDTLLAAEARHAADAPWDASLDPGLRLAARTLRRSLVRVHPSFRFEERLAGRLAELAAARSRPAAAAGGGAPVPFGRPGTVAGAHRADRVDLVAVDPALPAILAGHLDPTADEAGGAGAPGAATGRPLLLGGAMASAAISLVGVAWVAWRVAHPAGVMARAARAARGRRAAARALPPIGAGPA